MTTPATSLLPPDAVSLLRALHEGRVEHVLIGGFAAGLLGAPAGERIVTIVPARFGRNLDRLAKVLRKLDARPRPGEAAMPGGGTISAEGLRLLGRWSLQTRFGRLQLDFEPPATAGHLDLFDEARRITIADGLEVEVAALSDLIRIAEFRLHEGDRAALKVWRAAYSSSSVSASQ
jgi:hypothetical protein